MTSRAGNRPTAPAAAWALVVALAVAAALLPAPVHAEDEGDTTARYLERVGSADLDEAPTEARARSVASEPGQASGATTNPSTTATTSTATTSTAVVRPLDVPGAIAGELLVTYAEDAVARPPRTRGAGPFQRANHLTDRVDLVQVAPDAAAAAASALAADPAVVAVEPNVRRGWSATPDDTSFAKQWAHTQARAGAAWDRFTGAGAGQTAPLIAILDSGIDATHPDLDGVVVEHLRAADGRIIPGEPQNDPCGIGHGTAVAGVAAAAGDDDHGVAGVLWRARVIDVALTSPENDCPGGPSDADTIAAMDHVTGMAEPPQVINLSLGASLDACGAAYADATRRARARGIVVVAAAGNDGSSRTSVPASCDGVISVGATAADGGRAGYSQQNPQVDLVAPGGALEGPLQSCPTFDQLVAEMVITTSLTASTRAIGGCPAYADPEGDRLQGITGTSFSAPYVAASVALLRQLAADRGAPLDVDQVEGVLESTARDLGEPGRDCEHGWGLLDLGAAAEAVVAGARPTPEADPPLGTGSCPGQDAGGAEFSRIAAGGATDDAVAQAVATAGIIPPGAAPYAVLARVDDFADALAGSALGLGLGPLLYTASSGGLDQRTESELLRVLDFEGRTPWVYVMGGRAAIPATVDARLEALGIMPIRIAGTGRESTAVAASAAVEDLKSRVTFPTRDDAFLAYGRDFPDAVAAGQVAARYGIPVLVTGTDGPIHPDTRAELERLQPDRVLVLGGTAVLAESVVDDVRALGLTAQRLAGGSRIDTAMAVAELYLDELDADGPESAPPSAVAVNLRRSFTDALTASLLGGAGGVFLPLDGQDGSGLAPSVVDGFCGFGGGLLVAGDRASISDVAARRAAAVVDGTAC